jgi:hypothetical protein
MAKARQQSANQTEQLVQFRHREAQRIANAVAAHEARRRDRKPSFLPRAPGGGGGGGGGAFRLALFTGAWLKGTLKVVRFAAATNETVSAQNVFGGIAPVNPSNMQRKVGIAQEGTTWIAIAAECS